MKTLIDTLLEKDLVAYMLEYPHNTKEISSMLSPEAFTDALFEASYLACIELSQTNGTFTRADIFRLVKSRNKDLEASKILTLRPERSVDYEEACVELSQLLGRRKLNDMALSVFEMIQDGSSVDDIQVVISSSSEEINEVNKTTAVVDISRLYDETIESLAMNAGKTKISGVDTGSRQLNYTFGGWQDGNMIVIAARPSAGKTIVGLDFAKKAAIAGSPTLVVSLEMPASHLMYRFISSEASEYKYSDLGAYRVTPEDIDTIRQSDARRLKGLPIYFYDGDNRDINYLSNIITAQVRQHKIKLVVIDYLQLMRDGLIKDMSDFAQVSSISNKIQKLARKLNIPIIVLSQLSRAVEQRNDKRPQLSDIRSSGNVEQDASIVIGLYRPHYYALQEAKANGQPEPTKIDTTIEFVVLKNRNGRTGTVYRHCDIMTNRVEDEETQLMTFDEMKPLYSNSVLSSVDSDFIKEDTKLNPF